MHIVEHFLYSAERDSELIENIRKQGDDLSVPRDVDYCLGTDDKEKAETVCSFINDNQYGNARVEDHGGSFRIITLTRVPLHRNIIHTMSANMTSLAHIFSVEFIGWGFCLQIPDSNENTIT